MHRPRRWTASIALLLSGPACAAQRLVPPLEGPGGPHFARPGDLSSIRLCLAGFDATNRGPNDVAESIEALARALEENLRLAAEYGDIGVCDRAPAATRAFQASRAAEERARGGLREERGPGGGDALEEVALRAQVKPFEETARTYVLDVPFFFYPFAGVWPLTPAWGRAHVEIDIELVHASHFVDRFVVEVSAPYSMVFYSWYRTGPIEGAYRRAYGALFREVARRVASRIEDRRRLGSVALRSSKASLVRSSTVPPPLSKAALARSSTAPPPLSKERLSGRWSAAIALFGEGTAGRPRTAEAPSHADRLPAIERGAPVSPPTDPPIPYQKAELSPRDRELLFAATSAIESGEIRLPEEGMRIVVDPVARPRSDGLFGRYLASLGGVEVSRTGGSARVSSRASTEFLGVETVGSGETVTRGYRVSFSRPPDRTSIFFPPRLGFFSEDIEIRGFRDALPVFQPSGATEIPAVVSDPASGLPIDIGEPIKYFLRLRSGYVGQSLGLNFVFGVDDVQLFSTALVGLNVLEVRHTDVAIAESREKGFSVAAFGSGQAAAQIGIEVPDWHVAIRTAGELEWFRAFRYPEPLEFRASVAFHPEKRVFERQRAFVEGASLVTANWQVSVLWLF